MLEHVQYASAQISCSATQSGDRCVPHYGKRVAAAGLSSVTLAPTDVELSMAKLVHEELGHPLGLCPLYQNPRCPSALAVPVVEQLLPDHFELISMPCSPYHLNSIGHTKAAQLLL